MVLRTSSRKPRKNKTLSPSSRSSHSSCTFLFVFRSARLPPPSSSSSGFRLLSRKVILFNDANIPLKFPLKGVDNNNNNNNNNNNDTTLKLATRERFREKIREKCPTTTRRTIYSTATSSPVKARTGEKVYESRETDWRRARDTTRNGSNSWKQKSNSWKQKTNG